MNGPATFYAATDAVWNSDALMTGDNCRRDLDNPDPDWGPIYPGSWKECNAWETSYLVITWIWLVFATIASLSMIAIAITSFVRVYKQRNNQEDVQQEGREGTRWTIPAGQVSFEVSVYWGAPAPRGAGRPGQGETADEDNVAASSSGEIRPQ